MLATLIVTLALSFSPPATTKNAVKSDPGIMVAPDALTPTPSGMSVLVNPWANTHLAPVSALVTWDTEVHFPIAAERATIFTHLDDMGAAARPPPSIEIPTMQSAQSTGDMHSVLDDVTGDVAPNELIHITFTGASDERRVVQRADRAIQEAPPEQGGNAVGIVFCQAPEMGGNPVGIALAESAELLIW